ncbi:MAG: hypothetical protein Q9M34_07305 [Sulfurimonas sp.]|nr:hypothetical protein [Sulfurimonas sp.]
MELKDVILSTLAEMEETDTLKEEVQTQASSTETFFEATPQTEEVYEQTQNTTQSELMYLNSIRERLLVLFEGFQAPNNTNIEAKIDMTLNFLEYTLATIDLRVKKLEKEQ